MKNQNIVISLVFALSGASMAEQNSMELVMRCNEFGSEKHQFQRRDGTDIPYFNHPIQVARLVANANGSAEAICAALLHDVIEDQNVSDEEMRAVFSDRPDFGEKVLGTVKELTDPPGMKYEDVKQYQLAKMNTGYSTDAKLVKLADQTSNMRELVANPPKWGNNEEQEYIVFMKKLVSVASGTNLAIETLFEKAYQEAAKFYSVNVDL